MNPEENREYSRNKMDKITEVNLHSDTNGDKKGCLQNISKSGAFIRGNDFSNTINKIIIKIPRKKPITRNCEVTRIDVAGKKWIGIKFDIALSEKDLRSIIGNDEEIYLAGDITTLDFAKIDRAEVFRETQQIKTCSSNAFFWSMGLISSFTVTTYTLAIKGILSSPLSLLAVMSILGFFSLAIITNIEKARAINKREGFMTALDFYLNRNQGPQDYKGWFNLKHAFTECGARRRGNICPLGIDSRSNETCRDIGRRKADGLLASKRVIPGILDSFISLTSTFYAILFIILLVFCCYSLAMTNKEVFNYSIYLTITIFIIGNLLGFILWKNKMVVIGVILGVIISYYAGEVFKTNYAISFGILCFGALLGYLAWFLSRQIIILRFQHTAFESYAYMWLEIINNCIFLPDEATKQRHSQLTNWEKITNWIFGFKRIRQ